MTPVKKIREFLDECAGSAACDAAYAALTELEAGIEAQDQQMLCILDGTFSVGDGTAQREIERLRAEIDKHNALRSAVSNTSALDESLPPFCDGCGQEIDPDTCHCGSVIGDYGHDNHDPVPMGCRCLYDQMDWAVVAKGLRSRLREEREALRIPVLDARSVELWDAINAFADSPPMSDGRMNAVVRINRALAACGLHFRQKHGEADRTSGLAVT